MNRIATPKQRFNEWEVEFEGYVADGMHPVDCVATVVLDDDGAAFEISACTYFTPENIMLHYSPSERETEKLFSRAQKQFDAFMEEA